MTKFNRAYCVYGIGATMCNWNADFDKYPKMIGDIMVGSDKAFKYALRSTWEQDGDNLTMFFKSFKEQVVKGSKTIVPRTLKERYQELFDVVDLEKTKDKTEIIKNLLKTTDAKNFGFTFAEAGANFDCTGVVQITQGVNVYPFSDIVTHKIMSPFKNPKDDTKGGSKGKGKDKDEDSVEEVDGVNIEADDSSDNNRTQTSLGDMILVDKAQYMYGTTINPNYLKRYIKMGYTEGYTREDYEKFKKTSIVAATALNTVAKAGAENNFALFIETDETLHLGNLSPLVNYEYKNDIDTFDLTTISKLVNDCGDRITSVEVYYNPYKSSISGYETIKDVKIFNILTGNEIK